jgi:sulfate transport system ATP-binding protein
LLDEPFGALDANVRRDLRRWLRSIHDELGITTLFVTHDQEEALDLADRVVILDKGKIVQQGTPEEVCRHPANAFVMRFLGDTNALKANVSNGQATVGNMTYAAEGLKDGPAELLFRPTDVLWTDDASKGVGASIERVLDRPGSRRVLARTAGDTIVEFDVSPDFAKANGDQGFIEILRPRLFQD